MVHSYQQPVKRSVRARILTKAIAVLTSGREQATIAQPDEVAATIAYAKQFFRSDKFKEEIDAEFAGWRDTYTSNVGKKRPQELQILYLCGPEPLNDLEILLANGVMPHNVWAVESSTQDLGLATKALSESYPSVRLHPGDVSDLLRVYPGRFDIIYYDACASMFRDDSVELIVTLLKEVKLQPLSVLITNVSEVPQKYRSEYASVLSSYFRFRYNDLPREFWSAERLDPAFCEHDDSELLNHIERNAFEAFYSDFVTRFIGDLARFWIPNCRALALKAVSDHYLIEKPKLIDYLERAKGLPAGVQTIEELVEKIGDLALSPSSYPVHSFYEALKQQKHPFLRRLASLEIGGEPLDPLLGPASVLNAVVEGHWAALSQPMLLAIANSWFDAATPFSCDAPLPNLLVNSLLGIYGYPYFPNLRESDRVSYKAKSTKMFTDVIVFDQCRYYYDWFPTLLLVPARFKSRSFQVVARCILDRIGRNDQSSSSHPFRGAAVAPMRGIPAAGWYNMKPREEVT